MEALIIYDSNFGNTKKVAEILAATFGNNSKAVSVNDFKREELSEKKLLVVGSPINAWRPTKKIIKFLEHLNPADMAGIKTAAFDTRVKSFISGNAANKIAKRLQNTGAELLGEPMGFYVKGNEGPLAEGEIERVKEWAKSIRVKL